MQVLGGRQESRKRTREAEELQLDIEDLVSEPTEETQVATSSSSSSADVAMSSADAVDVVCFEKQISEGEAEMLDSVASSVRSAFAARRVWCERGRTTKRDADVPTRYGSNIHECTNHLGRAEEFKDKRVARNNNTATKEENGRQNARAKAQRGHAPQHMNPSQMVTKPSCQVKDIATKAQDINAGAPKMCKHRAPMTRCLFWMSH